MKNIKSFQEFVNEQLFENYTFITFSVDDEKLDQLLHKNFSKSIDYFKDGGDEYYTLPKREFDRFIDLGDSHGFDVDYEESEDAVVYVIENTGTSEGFTNEGRDNFHGRFDKITHKVYPKQYGYQNSLDYDLGRLGFTPDITLAKLVKDPLFKQLHQDYQDDIIEIVGVKGKYAKFVKEFASTFRTFGSGFDYGRYDDFENKIYKAAAFTKYQQENNYEMILWSIMDGIEYSSRKKLQTQYGTFSEVYKQLNTDEIDYLIKYSKRTVDSFIGQYFTDWQINKWIQESIKSQFQRTSRGGSDYAEEYYFSETNWVQKEMAEPLEFIKNLILNGSSVKWDTLSVERKMLDSKNSSVVSSSFTTYYYYKVKLELNGRTFNLPSVLGGTSHYSGGWN